MFDLTEKSSRILIAGISVVTTKKKASISESK